MNKIEELQKEADRLHKLRVDILNQIDDLKDSLVVPDLKLKFEGKYFVAINSFDSVRKWKQYLYVKNVKDSRYADVLSFETDTYNNMSINNNDASIDWLSESTEISRESFVKNLKIQLDKSLGDDIRTETTK